MARMAFFIVTAFFLAAMFNIMAFDIENDGGILTFFGVNDLTEGDFNTNSNFLTNILITLATAVGAGIVIGFLTKQASENFVMVGFITATIIFLIGSATNTLVLAGGYPLWISVPVGIFMIGYIIAFLVTALEFFRGNT